MGFHKFALSLSVLCILASIALVCFKGLNFGIDFAGGVLIEARIKDGADIAKVRELISEEIKDVQIQNGIVAKEAQSSQLGASSQNSRAEDVLIRVAKTGEDQALIVKKVQQILQQNFSAIEYRKISYVGPQVGLELMIKGIIALILSFVFIMIYVWIRFDWQFGLGGIFALVHDAALTMGFFAITGLEFNLTSIAAILTIIGYSINDSVVIYDRIRENMARFPKMTLGELINSSANSTLSRTILTAGATIASLLALIFYGGDALFSFACATFFGIVIGTYSSIYISAPILIYLDPRKKSGGKILHKKPTKS